MYHKTSRSICHFHLKDINMYDKYPALREFGLHHAAAWVTGLYKSTSARINQRNDDVMSAVLGGLSTNDTANNDHRKVSM